MQTQNFSVQYTKLFKDDTSEDCLDWLEKSVALVAALLPHPKGNLLHIYIFLFNCILVPTMIYEPDDLRLT